jgi:hypothetical protein
MSSLLTRRRFLLGASIATGIVLADSVPVFAQGGGTFSRMSFTLRWRHLRGAPTPIPGAKIELLHPWGAPMGYQAETDSTGYCFFPRIDAPMDNGRPRKGLKPFFIRVKWLDLPPKFVYFHGGMFPNNAGAVYNQGHFFNLL